jgi:hypothetical protein
MSELEKSLVAWVRHRQINSNGLSKSLRTLTELCDGNLLYELLSQM